MKLPLPGLRWCRWTFVGLVILQIVWFGWLQPTTTVFPAPWALVVALVPLLPLLPGVWRLDGKPLVIAGCVLLLYFCFAVMEGWSGEFGQAALLQIALIAVYFTALLAIRRRPRSAPE
ncbi:MAG: DUF2069 domain-containing protein [Wenzhouxiangella sp.]|jgi:uncharacterized membrane protein|nr:DUF2069 domain-containing protein [Wenzhouxiangella sp.]